MASKESNPPPTKIKSVLAHMIPGNSLNFQEAYRKLHDSCLHTTVSTLQNAHGVKISREFETVDGWMDSKVRCRRYWIAPKDRAHAKKVLERLR